MKSLFRISRVRIRWADSDERSLPARTVPQSQVRPPVLSYAPWNWRVRVKWVGFGPRISPASSLSSLAADARTLHTFDLPRMQVRVRWLGPGDMRYGNIWVLALLAACVWLGLFTMTGFPTAQDGSLPGIVRIDPAGLEVVELNLAGDAIRVSHSPLDIGQPQDAFDRDLETLMRGREANPFVLDFEFSEPQPVRGLIMDFGRMDFILRVQVYDNGESSPVIYEEDYRSQPPIPHVDLNFVNGPEQVRRITIEIEQLNPPDEVHIHIREVLFKE
jgi:hypothetical protein